MNDKMTPMRAIRAKCLDCCSQNVVEVRNCEIEACPLHPYRMGHNPKRKGIGDKNFGDKLKTQKS